MKMNQYIYDFSVVMAVYNVERFLREAVDSLIHQTIGFDRIQLILVDDGSTDGSSAICEEYKARYPENIIVIHKENGRQASARNAGLPHVQGKYVNFMDSDDTMELTAFKKAYDFMEAHQGEVDICCIPVYFFGNSTGPHMLNDKFEKGTRVIDLMDRDNSYCILLATNSSFYSRDCVKKILFDTQLYHAEDAKINLNILMDKPKLGVVANTRYNYRKHGNSTVDKSRYSKTYYITDISLFSNWALDEAKKRFAEIPGFIQFLVMYDLQWKLKQERIPNGVLSKEENVYYRKYLVDTICRIDDDIILAQKFLDAAYKTYILGIKHSRQPELRPAGDGNLALCFGDTEVTTVSDMRTVWDFLTVDEAQKTCTLEGYHIVYGLPAGDILPCLLVDGREVACEVTDRSRMAQISLGERISGAVGFRARLPLADGPMAVQPAVKVGSRVIPRRNVEFGDFFPVSRVYENAWARAGGRVVTADGDGLHIVPCPAWTWRFSRECRLLIEIWKKNLLGGRKAVFGRLYYHLARPFKRRKLWIISDRIMKADDNGEALFRHIMAHRPKNTRVLFALNKRSVDYPRMSKVGKCVDAMSFRHKLLHLLCDVNISSAAEDVTINPFEGHHEALRDLLTHQRFVFLQHGITQNDISYWLNRYNKNIAGFVTAALPEYSSIVEGEYHYSEDNIWLTGFPRYDRLYHDEQKKITLMPTWRKYLFESIDGRSGIWKVDKTFEESAFYRFYHGLLKSNRLLLALERTGYNLQFFPHPVFRLAGVEIPRDPRVAALPIETDYRDVYAVSELVVTDYSSAVFDFAYLRKPVFYCQFDRDTFFSGDHGLTKGYFDYERDGFGEVTYDLESTIDQIIEYVENDCKLKDKYRKRIDKFFAFNDQGSCKRVLEKILALAEK